MQKRDHASAGEPPAAPRAMPVVLALRRSSLWGTWLYVASLVACGVAATVASGSAGVAWAAFLTVVGMGWFALFGLETWVRRTAPLIVGETGIELAGAGEVPWDAVDAVVINRWSVSLDLNVSLSAPWPPWFTAHHHDMLGDGDTGTISVGLRRIDATRSEIKAAIERCATVRDLGGDRFPHS